MSENSPKWVKYILKKESYFRGYYLDLEDQKTMNFLKNRHFVLILLLLITNNSNANTQSPIFLEQCSEIQTLGALFENDLFSIQAEIAQHVIASELTYTSVEPVNFITRNLTHIYTICVILVLINLIAQIKIIYQMANLFFQFRKKDELVNYST